MQKRKSNDRERLSLIGAGRSVSKFKKQGEKL
jgi:hypothetical protein